MSSGLLIVERMVIESLGKKDRNIKELEFDTGLSHALLLNVLPSLIMKNIVQYAKGQYMIDQSKSAVWSKEINDVDNVKEEVKELFTSLVNQYFKKETKKELQDLKVKKVWLSRDEVMVLNSHLANLESFFHSIRQERKLKPQIEKTHEQRVVVWGFSQYSDLIEGVLKAV